MKRCVFLMTLLAVLAMAMTGFAADPPNPIKDAKVGEWALYQMMGPMQQKQTVTARDAESVTIKIDMIVNGQVANSATTKIRFDQLGPAVVGKAPTAKKPKMGTATVDIKGRKIECVTIEVQAHGKSVMSYVSDDVPVYGLVMSKMGEQVMMKLIDFGK